MTQATVEFFIDEKPLGAPQVITSFPDREQATGGSYYDIALTPLPLLMRPGRESLEPTCIVIAHSPQTASRGDTVYIQMLHNSQQVRMDVRPGHVLDWTLAGTPFFVRISHSSF